MKLVRSLASLAALTMLFTACGSPTLEDRMQESMNLMEKMVVALEGVSSKETAQKAVQTIRGLVPQMKEAKVEGEKLGEPSKELKEKYEPQMEALQRRLIAASMKLEGYPEEMEAISKEMEKIG